MKILIIDIETTGLHPDSNYIVEIGATELDLSNGQTKIVFDSLCQDRNMTQVELQHSWIVKNGFINPRHVLKAPLIERVIKEFQEVVNQYPAGCTAYNNNFDFGFLEKAGIKFTKKLPDPMIIATPICKIVGKYDKFKWPKVQEAYDYLFPNSGYHEKHRGADDSLHEAQIVMELYRKKVFAI